MPKLTRRTLAIGAAVAATAALTTGALIAQSAQAAVAPGAPAPAFSVRDTTGATRTLAEFRGKTVVLEWSNHDCPYVRKHYGAGNMQALQREATAAGAVWLTVISSAPGEQGHVDAAGANAQTSGRNAAPTAVLLDPTGAMGRAYGALTTPHMFVISGDGRVVYQGAIDSDRSPNPARIQGATNFVRAALADIAAGRAVATPATQPYGCSVKYG